MCYSLVCLGFNPDQTKVVLLEKAFHKIAQAFGGDFKHIDQAQGSKNMQV